MFSPASSLTPSDPGSLPSPSTANSSKLIRSWGYLQFPISYRDLEAMLADRGVAVDHTTMYRWVQRFAPELEKRMRRHLRPCRGPWHVDETYIRVNGQWRYLYRAVDGTGQTI